MQAEEVEVVTRTIFDPAFAAIKSLDPPTGTRRGRVLLSNQRQLFSITTAKQRQQAFDDYLRVCTSANFSDFLTELVENRNPDIEWDLVDDQNLDADNNDDKSDDDDETGLPSQHLPSSSSSASSSSSSLSTFRSASSSLVSSRAAAAAAAPLLSTTSTISTICKFKFNDYTKMAKNIKDMLNKCIEPTCSLLWKDHQNDRSTFKMPSGANCFPIFRDPNNKLMSDPHEFLVKLERQLRLYSVPSDSYGIVLVSCVTDRLMQDWIEQHLIPNCSTWSEMKEMFKEKYFDPEIKERLIGQLEKCVQAMGERVHQYTERFQSLVVRISSGTPIDTQTNIISCERGFIPAIRQELAKYRSMMTQQQRSTFEFAKLSDLYETAANTERGLAPRTGKVGSTSLSNNNSRKRSFNGRQKRTQLNAVSSTSAAAATPVVNKIEMNEQGQPVNVNKKHKAPNQRPHFQLVVLEEAEVEGAQGVVALVVVDDR
jgi:hypothetical protein